MKRIGLVIFITIVVGLILNISLISKFGGIADRTVLVLGLLVVNSVILGFVVNKMLIKNLYFSFILLLVVVYLITLFGISSSMFFTIDYAGSNINSTLVVKEVKVRENFNEYICDIKDINNMPISGKKACVTANIEDKFDVGTVVKGEIKVDENYGYAYSQGAEISSRLMKYTIVGSEFTLNKYLMSSQNKIKSMLNRTLGLEYSDIIGAFIIGTSLQNLDSKNALIQTGIYHIMAISGLHIGILVSGVLGVLSLILYRRNARWLTIILVLVYGLVTGLSFSTTRAIGVMTIALIGQIYGTKDDKLNTVGVAGALILVINPLAIFNLGFIYSFTIVFGLILTTPSVKYIIKMVLRLSYAKENKVLDYVATIITAQLYFIPLSLFMSGNLYIYSFFANLLTIFVVPVLFAGSILVLAFYGTFLESVFVFVTRFLVDYIIGVANFFVSLPNSEVSIGTPSKFVVGLCYLVLFLVSYYLTKNVMEVNNGHFGKIKVFKER